MIKVSIPHKIYSDNKVKIKNIIKKYGMSWDSGKNGWINAATGDGVYIDRAIMDMILSDSFSGDMPMTMFIDSRNPEFLSEMKAKCEALGGELIEESGSAEQAAGKDRPVPKPAIKPVTVAPGRENVYTRLKIRDSEGCTTDEFAGKGAEDLKDISCRWERRKKQIVYEYRRMGMDAASIDSLLHREEIAFRKNNACWVTGDFPSAEGKERSEEKED